MTKKANASPFVTGTKVADIFAVLQSYKKELLFHVFISNNEQLVTRTAQNTRTKDILYRKNYNLKQVMIV